MSDQFTYGAAIPRMGATMGGRERFGRAVVVIGGTAYDRMLSLTVKNSMKTATCEAQVVFSWPGGEQFNLEGGVARQFVAGARAQIILDDQLAATCIVDSRQSKGSPKHYELTFNLRGTASIGVDSNPKDDTIQYDKMPADQIIRQLTQGFPFGIEGSLGGGEIGRFVVADGDTVERAARRLARERGGKFWETPAGNWIMQGKGQWVGSGGAPLILGKNILQWSVKQNMSMRYGSADYTGMKRATDKMWGKDAINQIARLGADIGGLGGDKNFSGQRDTDQDNDSLEQAGGAEMDDRESMGLNVQLRMSTWTDDGGTLWGLNTKHFVSIPVDEVNETCILEEVTFELTPDSRQATLVLVGEGSHSGGGVGEKDLIGGKSTLYTPNGRRRDPAQQDQQDQKDQIAGADETARPVSEADQIIFRSQLGRYKLMYGEDISKWSSELQAWYNKNKYKA